MEFEDVRKAVTESVREFKDRDQYLRQIDSSERNMVDIIARYLVTRIKHLDVDTEYNRYGKDIPKSLHRHHGLRLSLRI